LIRTAAALAACVLLAGCATAPRPSPPSTAGFLSDAAVTALLTSMPLAPVTVAREPLPEPQAQDRWWLATAHAELRPPWAAQHFDCVLGTRLASKPRPALERVMGRLLVDADNLSRRMSAIMQRARPVAAIPGLEPCQRISSETRASNSWPATGAAAGAAWGELFAALAPDRADALRHVGREIGVSRAICRMNWPTDVEAGAMAGLAIYHAASRTPDFAADLEAARAELAAARAEGLANPSCAAERRALSTPGAAR
jgi:acid phosphatase (class A)